MESKLDEKLQHKPTVDEVMTIIETKFAEFSLSQAESSKQAEPPSWADVVSKHVDSKIEQVTGNLTVVQRVLEDTKKMALEEKDKELRCNNIVVYRVPEGRDSKEENYKQDRSFCYELIGKVLEVDFVDEDVKKICRLGKRGETNRPLLIQLREKRIKNRIMESLYELKEAEDIFKNVPISHDMTQQERSDCKMAVEEAKRQSAETGEWLWRARDLPGLMKVIRIPKRQD